MTLDLDQYCKKSVLSQPNPRVGRVNVHFTCFPKAWQVCVCVYLWPLMGGLLMGFASGKCAPSVAKMDSGCSQESWLGGGAARRARGSVHLQCAPPGPVQQMSDELVL